MKNNRCLYCYGTLNQAESDFHAACCRKFFGSSQAPLLPYAEEEMYELGAQVIRSQAVITGVQPKISLHLGDQKSRQAPQRFTIVGLWGNYILKPPFEQYPHLPELEHLSMQLAEASGMETVPHSLIRLTTGSLAYITKRVDRDKTGKIQMEDMCQLTERLTEDKYKGSYEQIGKAILKYSANPMLDMVLFFEQVTFSFLTGNADMHLKNFSFINRPGMGWTLCPAYDMVATALVVEGDNEELALNLNGRKKKMTADDFRASMKTCQIPEKAAANIFRKFNEMENSWIKIIRSSFLPEPMQENFEVLIKARMKKLFA